MGQQNSKITTIEHTNWQGEPAIRLCAGGYEAIMLPKIGANVISLKYLEEGLHILRTPEDLASFKARPQSYGIPVLFPPNRIEDGTFIVGESTYHFPINSNHNNHIHGFLHTRPWVVTRLDVLNEDAVEAEVVFTADKNTDFFPYFPHEFQFTLVYHLSSEGLMQKASITNQSKQPMPFGLGYHTALRVPFHPNSSPDDYRLLISIGTRWELNERMLPTGVQLPLSDEEMDFRGNGKRPFGPALDNHYTALPLIIRGTSFHGAKLEDQSKNLRLIYEVGENYKHWMIWNGSGNDGFICPEPQTWTVNAPNLSLPHEITGLKILAPGETWKETCRLYIRHIE